MFEKDENKRNRGPFLKKEKSELMLQISYENGLDKTERKFLQPKCIYQKTVIKVNNRVLFDREREREKRKNNWP